MYLPRACRAVRSLDDGFCARLPDDGGGRRSGAAAARRQTPATDRIQER
ncbi:hypothetical protein STENM223S_08941 [Streptomyces tendae]